MKKFFSVILTVLYFSLSTGAMVNFHYCGGELESVKINSESQSCCCGSGLMAKGCCQDKEVILGLDIDENIVFKANSLSDNLFLFFYTNYSTEIFNQNETEDNNFVNYKIPPPKLEPIWLINCSLTYYG